MIVLISKNFQPHPPTTHTGKVNIFSRSNETDLKKMVSDAAYKIVVGLNCYSTNFGKGARGRGDREGGVF